jgi:NADH-quinone oxidoreductase subunit M
MLNGFVSEFLILSGSFTSAIEHHVLWSVIATTGVIFSAAYALSMIQRVFYGEFGLRSEEVAGYDLNVREHITLWPFVALFLCMGLFSPYWMRSIDSYGTLTADQPDQFNGNHVHHLETGAFGRAAEISRPGGFVDPGLAAAAQGKPAPPTNQGARY